MNQLTLLFKHRLVVSKIELLLYILYYKENDSWACVTRVFEINYIETL